jgi:hypothetical protein
VSYPQAPASIEVNQGQEFYRLYTRLISSGDVYEMDVSAKAFCIGPQSDVARAKITYYDPAISGNAQSFIVGVGDPFVGRIDSIQNSKYASANIGARIIITPEDLLGNSTDILNNPLFSVNALDWVIKPNPFIDVLGYLSQPPFLPAKRASRYFRGILPINSQGAGTGVSWMLIPWYGRTFASIKFTNLFSSDISISIFGASVLPTGANNGTTLHSNAIQILSPTTCAAGTNLAPEVRASTSGEWDWLVVRVSGDAIGVSSTAGIYYNIVSTDEEL